MNKPSPVAPYLPIAVRNLIDALVVSTLGWNCQADRFYQTRTEYILRKRFRPLHDMNDALLLLEAVKPVSYMIQKPISGRHKVTISMGPMNGVLAAADSLPECIFRACLAARGIAIPAELMNVSMAEVYGGQRE
jgi:hypothetical protein